MIKFYVDVFTYYGARGWAFSNDGTPVSIEAWSQNKCIGVSHPDKKREDVARAYPTFEIAGKSGFYIDFDRSGDAQPLRQIQLRAIPFSADNTPLQPIVLGSTACISDIGIAASKKISQNTSVALSPFPKGILALVYALWPACAGTQYDDRRQEIILEKIILLFTMDGSHSIPVVAEYGRFLRSTWVHFQFVEKYFPHANSAKSFASKDISCKANTPEELMSIAHHLYVLQSYGIKGDFAEFGCFKGYSSSMLSYACAQLGIKMHIFDSFSGLPDTDGDYYAAGDFAGGIDEVKENIGIYGSPEAVEYHIGWYSESLKIFQSPPLISLWMDVDLESSSQDVSVIFDKIDKAGAVFSHECGLENFSNGEIHSSRGSGCVIPPIMDRFAQLEITVEGRFVCGCTGAFWQKEAGCPVLSNTILHKLIAMV